MHEGRVWYVPAFIKDYEEGVEPSIDGIVLFTQIDADTGEEFIPVFDNSEYCDNYLGDLSAGKRDKALCIYRFRDLSDLEMRVREAFEREIQLIVCTSDKPDEEEL